MLGTQSTFMFASLITLLHFSASALMSAAYCSGEPAIGCSVLGRSTFWRYSVSAKMRRISPLSLAMISAGRAAGRKQPEPGARFETRHPAFGDGRQIGKLGK